MMTATRPIAEVRSDMEMFDRLPKVIRDRMNETPSRLSIARTHALYISVEAISGEDLAIRYVMQVMDLIEKNAEGADGPV